MEIQSKAYSTDIYVVYNIHNDNSQYLLHYNSELANTVADKDTYL
jgi:hypothetical protein